MTLADRLKSELHRFGLTSHPLGSILPSIVREYQRDRRVSRRWAIGCVLLVGIVLGSVGALAVIWQRLDAMSTRNDVMAAACLNPPKVAGTLKAQFAQRKEKEQEP